MKFITPSYLAYLIRILEVTGFISTKTAALAWPYVLVTSILGVVLILIRWSAPKYNNIYSKYFSLPLIELFPENVFLVEIFFIFYKIHLLLNFPQNYKYTLHLIFFLVFYCAIPYYYY